ncbi:YetF domain-containing protein [Pelosinus sp. sgz500959]|uniref:YetF domain-containing protein n=1 Tax=Pelosinus sp. sgz500959 TaxID=3242472 RepID=UPI003671C9A5
MEINDLLRDIWQTILIFISLLIFARILDKTQIGQLTFHEYISGITIGSIAGSLASAEPNKFWSHYVDLFLFFLLTYLLSLVTIKNRPLRKIIEGSPSIIIENGRILKENMKSLRYDLDELNSQLREKGVLDISEVQYATIEPTGQLSVILKPDFQPLTKGDMNIHLPYATFPVELIMDGEIVEENLVKKSLTHDWLDKQLTDRNIKSAANVMYAVIDSKGQLFISSKGSLQ